MKLTQAVLKTISRQLCHGNPWWALVVLNEYLEPESPLHAALLRLFWRRVSCHSELASRLCAGARYKDLSEGDRHLIGSRVVVHHPHEHSITRAAQPVRRHFARHPPSRRVSRSSPTGRRGRRRERFLQPQESPTSTISRAAPALRIVRGPARRSS